MDSTNNIHDEHKSISKFFIVTPSFNSEKTISRTISSVLSQAGNFDIYYHIQDAGSTDNTLSIIEKWQILLKNKAYPFLCNSITLTYDSSPDNGMYDAILTGFDTFLPQEEGWLSWINSDDYFFQGAFATLDTINNSTYLSDTIEWVTGTCSINRDTMPIYSADRALSKELIKTGLSDGKFWEFVQQEGTFFKRTLWDKVNKTDGFSKLKYAGDWYLWVQFARHTDIYQFKYPLASFSVIKGQLSQVSRSAYEEEIETIISTEEKLNFFKNLDVESIKSLYFSTSYGNSTIKVEEEDIINKYRSKAKYLNIINKNLKEDYRNDREALIKKLNEIIDYLKNSVSEKAEQIKKYIQQINVQKQQITSDTQTIKNQIQQISEYKQIANKQKEQINEQNNIIKDYINLLKSIKKVTQIKTSKYPLTKLKNYKEMLKLFHILNHKHKNIENHILPTPVVPKKKKVFIFANCHGAIYKNQLSLMDKNDILEIEHLLSYENINNYENIKHKFSECDILIIQPVQNYSKFKLENLTPLLKEECTLIRIPFIRFNGYWNKDDIRELTKFKQAAVMFFPNLTDENKISTYINGDSNNDHDINRRFESGIEELKDLEQQGDIEFVNFFMEYHTLIPLFRDAYHPTQIMYDFISHQLIELVRKEVPSLLKSTFSIPDKWEKEYGHFKPIDNHTAKVLSLQYDLDSYFKYSRLNYLKAVLHYENQPNTDMIDDLVNLKKVLNSFDETGNEVVNTYHNLIAYNKNWQFPAITEQHAFNRIYETGVHNDKCTYIAFPWATLIDLLHTKKEGSDLLLGILKQIKEKIPKEKKIITVCQHIKMLEYQDIFADLGITHVFWTHAIHGQTTFPEYNTIKIYPFPLYPVQAINHEKETYIQREFLYSFVGARANEWYLTQSRNYIIDILSQDKRGLVVGRDTWHYNKVVYEHQIKKNVNSKTDLVDNKTSQEFQDIVKKSIFSLCPSGSGPNSIRLWESIGFGSIPVILADTYLPPGNLKLWDDAVVYCNETEDAIRALPDYLEEIAKDKELLERKRHAMKQLWMIYGPDSFIYDIQKLFLSIETDSND